MQTKSDSDSDESLQTISPDFQRAISYVDQTTELKEKFPGVVIVEGIDALEDFLRYHTWTQNDVLNAFPWKVKLFRRTAGKTLPFILNTEAVRLAYPDFFKNKDKTFKNALKLFSPEDLKNWFCQNLSSTLETVLVPLTLFSSDPNAMRDEFKRIKIDYLQKSYDTSSRKKLRELRVSNWPEIIRLIRLEFRNQIGKYFDDAKKATEGRNIVPSRASFRKYEVQLPNDKLPIFFEKKEIGKTRDYDSEEVSYATYKLFGWAEHAFKEGVDPEMTISKKAYTQGLWFGGRDCVQDYENGLLELMTAERFVDIFGADALKSADWRFSKDLCSWAKPDAVFGPGFPPKELAVLLGLNYVAPKQK